MMRTAIFHTSDVIPTANCLAASGIDTGGWGGGKNLILSNKEAVKNNVSPCAVSRNGTAHGLFAFTGALSGFFQFEKWLQSLCQRFFNSENGFRVSDGIFST